MRILLCPPWIPNVLVRWLCADELSQYTQVKTLFETARSKQNYFFVSITVLLELEWVLRLRYQFDQQKICYAFNALLETKEILFQDESAIEYALFLYKQATADFADCIHAAIAVLYKHNPLLSFDIKAARMTDIQLIHQFSRKNDF